MTAQEVKDFIIAQLQVPVNVVQKVINSLNKIVDFVSSTVADIIPDWTSVLNFNTDGSGGGKYCKYPDTNGKKRIFETKTSSNVNNAPPNNPLVTENTHWKEVSPSSGSSLYEWSAGVYGSGLVIVYHTHSVDGAGLYRLLEATRPFTSTNIETEITAGKWERIGGSGSGKGIAKTYADIAAMLADQATQHTDFFYLVTDASADATVDAGWAVYQKLAATTGAIGDYRKLAEAESLDIIVSSTPDWDATTKGKVERSTQAEMEAIITGANTTSTTGLSDARTGSEIGLYHFVRKFITLGWTWTLQQIFTAAPRFSSVTASQFLKVDGSKDLVSVAASSQAEMITGTDNTKPATALSVESKRSVVSTSLSNSASGSISNDCMGKQEIKIVYTTTVTGSITITRTGDSALEILNITIPITGAGIQITFPSDVRMARYNEVASGDGWYESTKIMQVSSVGTADIHEFSLIKHGSIYILRYDGPVRA